MPRPPMIVDAHHHLWDPARRGYPWLESLTAINRAFALSDLVDRTAAAGVDATVLVQTVADPAETEEFLGIAGESADHAAGPVAGVVGWVDLTDPGVADEIARLRSLAGGEHLVGVRHQVQDEPDPEWLLRPDVGRGIAAVGAAGLVYDLLVLTPQLGAARRLVQAQPTVSFVLDHCAKPPIASSGWEPWASGVARLAESPNVVCKLSGLVTEARWDDWDVGRLRPYVEHVLACFGPDRLLFGSDWPVCELAASYDQWLAAARTLLSAVEAGQVFGGNAARVYRLSWPPPLQEPGGRSSP